MATETKGWNKDKISTLRIIIIPNWKLRHQHKNTSKNSQENISPPEPNNPTTVGPEKCNIAKAQDKDFKILVIKEDMNKCHNEDYKNTNKNLMA